MIERWTAGAAQDYRWFARRLPETALRIDRLLADITPSPESASPSRCG